MVKEKGYAATQKKYINYGVSLLTVLAVYFILNTLISTRTISNYGTRILMGVGINIILALGLNLIIGFTGQLTLGHAGFMSIGAYTSAVLSKNFQFPFVLALILGAVFAALVAALIGFPILRLKGDYLAICTLAFGQIIMVVIQNSEYLGGARGFSGIPRKTSFAWVYFIVVITFIIIRNIINSSQGRAMVSVREDEIAAEAMGINTTKYKLIAFTIAAFFAGLAGGLYGHYLMFIDPVSFNYMKSIDILTFVVFGGMGSLSGSVLGAGVLTYLPEILRTDTLKDYRILFLALLLIVLMIFRPQGLMGTKELSLKSFKDFKILRKGGKGDVTA